MSQLIDMEAAKEFMKETLEMVKKENLIEIADAIEEKGLLFRRSFAEDKLNEISKKELEVLLNRIFSIRRKLDKVYEQISFDDLKLAIYDLLHGADKIDHRFQKFFDLLGDLDIPLKYDLTSELLHFTFPDKYWLWSRWMWDPKSKTGAIPLVTTEGFDLEGETMSEVYMKIGKGVAFVHSVAESAEFQFINRSLYGTDVYLSCVYIIYSYTILKIKMTKEFNEVMPGMTEFSRRLLGVYGVKEAA